MRGTWKLVVAAAAVGMLLTRPVCAIAGPALLSRCRRDSVAGAAARAADDFHWPAVGVEDLDAAVAHIIHIDVAPRVHGEVAHRPRHVAQHQEDPEATQ